MSVTINAHQLGRLINRTIGHIGSDPHGRLHGIRLEADHEFLYAIASDGYTVAVARYRHHGLGGVPFARTLPAHCATSLREWLDAYSGCDPVTVTVLEEQIRFTAPQGELAITVRGDGRFFDWRGVLRGILEQTCDTNGAFPMLGTQLLGRFRAADEWLRVRVTADRQAVLFVGEDFLGAQMPTRARRDGVGAEHFPSLDQVHASWQHTLSVSEATTMADGIPAGPNRRRYEASKDVAETAGDLLKQTLRSTHHMVSTGLSSEALLAYAISGVMAWSAYRYLDALRTADPKLAATMVAETADELEGGEIGEFAWDAAKSAGHDPKKWSDEFEAWLAKREPAAEQASNQSPASAA
ncbi:hypothetical protein [Streptomyces sp. URMC 123]|uniref:hypothetical protein n=1 Tax=Streptomyces sp. URMC 123 TaxID=3423403 RepID=UPI003F1DA38B